MTELAIALLDDPHGISIKAWHMLEPVLAELEEAGSPTATRILECVRAVEGRVYLPENWD